LPEHLTPCEAHRMKILLSNDDGIHAPGIQALYESLAGLGELCVVAPDAERSAVGHAITIADPLKVQDIHREGRLFGRAVGGTPADCVKLACCALMDTLPDCVISGINLGPNAGISVIYSGTVSAATEGAILGIPSLAISLSTFVHPQWETAGKCARLVAERFLRHPPPPDCLINVNIPNRPFDEIQGFKVTRTARSRFRETFHRRQDPRGRVYYWLDGDIEALEDRRDYAENTDLQAIDDGFVSITPIMLDHTGYEFMEETKSVYE